MTKALRTEGLLLALFLALLGFHAWGTSVGWKNGNLLGNEFRQTQTAITAMFVQRDHDFSLAYPTPVLGKPWSVPFEFPLYQWTVVVVSDVTGWKLVEAARAVSAACFYLTLPAVWLLLGRIGLARRLRWLVLGVVVCCPLHIFYARSFLIEMMALLFSVWFLHAYVVGVERRSVGWLVVANLAGIGAGLVKVTTFMLYLGPALAWTLWWYGRVWREHGWRQWREWTRWTGWAAAAVALPFTATLWWLDFADHVKSLSPLGRALMSSKMNSYNFGTWETRTSPDVWNAHWQIQVTNIAGVAVLISSLMVALTAWGRWSRWALAAFGFFVAVQALFPVLYAWHEYYYVANTILLMVAIGLVLAGLWEKREVRPWQAWGVSLIVLGLQIGLYFQFLYPAQASGNTGGNNLTQTLSIVTDPDDVLVIAGEDWNSMTPYYAGRRAMMLRRNTEHEWHNIDPALDALAGETVGVLMVRAEQRENTELIDRVVQRFQLETEPSIRWPDTDFYLNPRNYDKAKAMVPVIESWGANLATSIKPSPERRDDPTLVAALPPALKEAFEVFSPLPVRFRTKFGISSARTHDQLFFGAHPDTWLWFDVAAGMHATSLEVDINPDAYQGLARDDGTDGIEVEWNEVLPNGDRRLLFSRALNPRDEPADRGLQKVVAKFEIGEGSQLELHIGPGPAGNYNRDWTGISNVRIR